MQTETYNGWKNRTTWALNLWLNNDYDVYNHARIAAQNDRLEKFVRDEWAFFPTIMRTDVGADLSMIDWEAITAGFCE